MSPIPRLSRALAIGVSLIVLTLPAQADELIERTYAPFAQLLEQFLSEHERDDGGLVSAFDYERAFGAAQTRDLLREQNRLLAAFDRDALSTREQALAFWNNAYNYFMIEHILHNPRNGQVVDSVRDYGHLLNPYRVFGQKQFNIGGRLHSLDQIEKEILLGDEFKRRGWKEARVHFTVNCASVGCPPLRQQIFLPDNVDAMMSDNTRRALNTPLHLRLEGNTLYLSQLFEWYEDDYVEEAGSVTAFIKRYADPRIRAKVDAASRIRFIDYDWSLNRPSNFPELRVN